MKKTSCLALFVSLAFIHLAQGQTTCTSFNTHSVALGRLQPAGTQEHSSGLHSWGITPVFGCTYTHGNSANCDTECTVTSFGSSPLDPIGGFLSVENGSLSAVGTHKVSGTWNPADSKAFGGGLSCSGTVAGGAANCFAVPFTDSCFISVTLSLGGVTVNTNGTTVWNSGPVPSSTTCPPQVDPQATPTPTPSPISGGGIPPDPCLNGVTIAPIADFGTTGPGPAPPCSPIIIDVTGDGFFLTSAANGVKFDIANTGVPIQMAWTANANNAFLVLDRNGDGVINSGAELFGNFTPQPASAHPNGFLALAQYDANGDGVIDATDPIYSRLRLWVDANHDGISQPEELHTLPEMGVYSISLDYSLSMRTDEFGNVFRYKAKVNAGQNGASDVGKKAYDVFFVTK